MTDLPMHAVQPVQPVQPEATDVYTEVGGEAGFRRLVADFYSRVKVDPVLRPLYVDEELEAAEDRLAMFLIQYWGGPRIYSERRGHPRLRMRHVPFAIGPAERDAWLANMRAALDGAQLPPEHDAVLWDYLHRAALSLQNRA